MTVPKNKTQVTQIIFGVTTPAEVDSTTTANLTYIRYNIRNEDGKEWIYLIDESGATIQFKRAYDEWTNRVTATYAMLEGGN